MRAHSEKRGVCTAPVNPPPPPKCAPVHIASVTKVALNYANLSGTAVYMVRSKAGLIKWEGITLWPSEHTLHVIVT